MTLNEQRRRLDFRFAREPESTWPISDEEMAMWAASFDVPTPGEIDGTEPVDPPPAGFASWTEWIQHRWPPRV
jgi:hypothetical protein